MPTPIDDYRAAAKQRFGILKGNFPLSANFWRLGYSFDTIVDYLTTSPADATGFGQIALDRYTQSSGTWAPHPWYDDFGWWGIAGLKASQQPDLFGDLTEQFKAVALACWYGMDSKAPYVWDRADQQQFRAMQPRFEGGVWNSDWHDDETEDCSRRCNPLRPCDGLCGFQNTVTNGLYLVLAARLVLYLPRTPDYLSQAKREYEFLKTWFRAPQVDPLLKHIALDKAVVRERVTAYCSGEKPWAYDEAMAWAGDQGLILGGLVDSMSIVKKPSSDYDEMRDTAMVILTGTTDYLVDKTSGLLQPWTPGMGPPGGDTWDYLTGIGVFMRYLLYAYQHNPELKAKLRSPDYQKFIRTNADHVLRGRVPGEDLGDEPLVDRVMIHATNDLATLLAGIVMLAPES